MTNVVAITKSLSRSYLFILHVFCFVFSLVRYVCCWTYMFRLSNIRLLKCHCFGSKNTEFHSINIHWRENISPPSAMGAFNGKMHQNRNIFKTDTCCVKIFRFDIWITNQHIWKRISYARRFGKGSTPSDRTDSKLPPSRKKNSSISLSTISYWWDV